MSKYQRLNTIYYLKIFRCLYRWCPPLPIPNREVKPTRADGTAVTRGRVGRCQILKKPCNITLQGFLVLEGFLGMTINSNTVDFFKLPPPKPDGTEILFGYSNLSKYSNASQKDWRDSRTGTAIEVLNLLYKTLVSKWK